MTKFEKVIRSVFKVGQVVIPEISCTRFSKVFNADKLKLYGIHVWLGWAK